MIIIITGAIGGGKSATLTYHILKNLIKGNDVYCNFSLKNLPKEIKNQFHLLEFKHLTDFEFWKKQYGKGLTIVLDEFHNIADSRRSASKRNVQVTQFLAQIRKVLKGHSTNHMFICTQYLRQVDVRTRDLSQHMIECTFIKGKRKEDDIIIQQHFKKNKYGDFYPTHRDSFSPSKVYDYYDTHELIDFGKSETYVG